MTFLHFCAQNCPRYQHSCLLSVRQCSLHCFIYEGISSRRFPQDKSITFCYGSYTYRGIQCIIMYMHTMLLIGFVFHFVLVNEHQQKRFQLQNPYSMQPSILNAKRLFLVSKHVNTRVWRIKLHPTLRPSHRDLFTALQCVCKIEIQCGIQYKPLPLN